MDIWVDIWVDNSTYKKQRFEQSKRKKTADFVQNIKTHAP